MLIQQGTGLSLQVLETGVVLSLMRDAWSAIEEYFAANGADIAFNLLALLLILLVFRFLSRLTRRGVTAEASHLSGHEIDVSDTILSRAADLQCDLVVMGAYGHSKLREMVLGGATHGLLEQMTVPVLMSH